MCIRDSAYSLLAHTLPSARGQGEPLSGRLDPPDGATFPGVLIGEPSDRWVLASSAGYGFVVKLEDLYSRNRAGKAVLNVPDSYAAIAPAVVPPGDEPLLAAVNSEGRLLTFPVADLPELPRGKGNKIFGISTRKSLIEPETLLAIAAVAPGQTLKVLCGDRTMGLSYRDLAEYRGERGQRGLGVGLGLAHDDVEAQGALGRQLLEQCLQAGGPVRGVGRHLPGHQRRSEGQLVQPLARRQIVHAGDEAIAPRRRSGMDDQLVALGHQVTRLPGRGGAGIATRQAVHLPCLAALLVYELDKDCIRDIGGLQGLPVDRDLSLIHISEPTRPY